jgi:hypothetical protein
MHLIELIVKMIHDGQGSRAFSALSPTATGTQISPNECRYFREKNDDVFQSIVNLFQPQTDVGFHVAHAEISTRRQRYEG